MLWVKMSCTALVSFKPDLKPHCKNTLYYLLLGCSSCKIDVVSDNGFPSLTEGNCSSHSEMKTCEADDLVVVSVVVTSVIGIKNNDVFNKHVSYNVLPAPCHTVYKHSNQMTYDFQRRVSLYGMRPCKIVKSKNE